MSSRISTALCLLTGNGGMGYTKTNNGVLNVAYLRRWEEQRLAKAGGVTWSAKKHSSRQTDEINRGLPCEAEAKANRDVCRESWKVNRSEWAHTELKSNRVQTDGGVNTGPCCWMRQVGRSGALGWGVQGHGGRECNAFSHWAGFKSSGNVKGESPSQIHHKSVKSGTSEGWQMSKGCQRSTFG